MKLPCHSSCKIFPGFSQVHNEASIEFVETPDIGDPVDLVVTKNLISNIDEKIWSVARKELNPYESPVPGYKTTVSRAYYKLWEILVTHPWLVNFKENKSECHTLHLCDAPGGFIGCVTDYFNRVLPSSSFKHFGLSLVQPDDNLVPVFKKQITDNPRVCIIKEGNCDINDREIATKIIKRMKLENENGVSFITADGGIPDKGEYNSKEDTHLELFLSEIFISLECLGEKGSLVMKFFDIYKTETLNLINTLYLFFDQVCICKPETSRPTNSEKYIVCNGFYKSRYKNSGMKNNIARVFYSEDKVRASKIASLFSMYHHEMINHMKKTNEFFRLSQIKSITETLDYIKSRPNVYFSNQKNQRTREIQNSWSKKYNFYNKY